MPRDGTATRTALMDAAEALILGQGFAATSVDSVIAKAGATKGAFFYHFKTKADLAQALVERYAELDLGHLHTNMARAEALSRDPLQQLPVLEGARLPLIGVAYHVLGLVLNLGRQIPLQPRGETGAAAAAQASQLLDDGLGVPGLVKDARHVDL